MTNSDAVYQSAQRSHDEPPEDGPDYLEGKPMGFCPWCDAELHDVGCPLEYNFCPTCYDFDPNETVYDNRARYVAEREAESKLEERIARESRKYGKGEYDE